MNCRRRLIVRRPRGSFDTERMDDPMALVSFLSAVHLIGLSLGTGSATVKVVLLFKGTFDRAFMPYYTAVAKPITRLIVLGLILLTLSGIGWLLVGYSFTPLLVVKIILVAAIWVLGPIIDNVVEPAFRKLAPVAGETASAAFSRIQKRYITLEVVATLLFYIIIIIWVRR
jgi:hypothetical protein